MSLNGLAHVVHDTSDVEHLMREFQLGTESLPSTMKAMRHKLAEFTKNNGRSESGNAEDGAAIGRSPRGAMPTALQESSGVEGSATADVGRESARGNVHCCAAHVRPCWRRASTR